MTKQRELLVTIGLPYANGEIHLGHLIEAIQADIWVRFQKDRHHTCYFISGSDAHGTATMLSAEKKGITPELLVEQVREDHRRDYAQFHVHFNEFYTTHSPENQVFANRIYEQLQKNGDITTQTITQFYDTEKQMFLADRYVRGNCPRCNASDQYGDNCEACGAAYNPHELKNPRSALTGTTPVQKESLHYFFAIDHYVNFLQTWTQSGVLQSSVANKIQEWFKTGLQSWNISRDTPYFGFQIPNTENKYFYVWLDAPIGYMASFQHFCRQKNPPVNFDDFWNENSKTELIHFIGKDIINFHALFWPAMLHGCHYRLPTKIHTHGFVTVNGEKMSKSRGTFITAKQFSTIFPTEYLRYYYAAKLHNQVEDIDFNLADFSARINADLVGKYVNLASRCAGFITKKFNGVLSGKLHDQKIFQQVIDAEKTIADAYDSLNFHRAVREIMTLADIANQYIDRHKPWALAKETGCEQELQQICTQGLNLFRLLTIYLKPILPETVKKVETFLNVELTWDNHSTPLLNHAIKSFEPLMQRVTPEQITALTIV